MLASLALSVALVFSGRSARCQVLGGSGDVAFAAERLMGVYLYDDGGDGTAFGLGAPVPDWGYRTARLGIDYFPSRHFSIGGAFAYFSDDPDGPGDGPDGFLIAPRIGYAIDIGRSFGFWPRGGITVRDRNGDSELALTLEGVFWAAPAPHFAFTFGPAFDIGIAGDDDESRSLGLITVGILGWI
jgi:hypothetical protein